MNRRFSPSFALLSCATLAAAALCLMEARQALRARALLQAAEEALSAASASMSAPEPPSQPSGEQAGESSIRDLLRSWGLRLQGYSGGEDGKASLRALANAEGLPAFLLALRTSPAATAVLSLRLSRQAGGYALDLETSDAAR